MWTEFVLLEGKIPDDIFRLKSDQFLFVEQEYGEHIRKFLQFQLLDTVNDIQATIDIGASSSEIENSSSEDEEDLVDNCWDAETDDQGHYSEDNLSNEDDDEYVLARDLP
ncbi:unnamed protein product [Didymodactylos carnosus]|uniref:Uncharacterized protein n=1 Tax=Didymodactylos carnosus TaxID=1234261 RepID=A0A8S2EYJ1_9BILA|nr:unnamed protein product [Didymodactylos carnosus]CAF4160755.1 unnamed protein product [Didymodactylos carnosus]